MEKIFGNKRYKTLLGTICAILWSLPYPLIKLGYEQFGILPEDTGGKIIFAGIRFFCAGVVALIFSKAGGQKLEIKNRKDYLWLLLLAFVNISFRYMCSYTGLAFSLSSRSSIIDSMSTFLLIVLSTLIFADDKMTTNKIIGCLLGFAGILMVIIKPGEKLLENISFLGDGMIILNAVFGAIGGLITRVVSRKMNISPATGHSMTVGGAILVIVGLAFGTNSAWTVTPRGLFILFVLLMISAVCFSIYNELLSYHPISEVAIFNALIPVMGVLFAALLLKEQLKWQFFVAVVLVALGIYLVNAVKAKKHTA